MQAPYVLLAFVAILAVNTYRLHSARKRGRKASYDGDEHPVTRFDVALSAIMCAAFLIAWLLEVRKP
jgi:hypothetical protein